MKYSITLNFIYMQITRNQFWLVNTLEPEFKTPIPKAAKKSAAVQQFQLRIETLKVDNTDPTLI